MFLDITKIYKKCRNFTILNKDAFKKKTAPQIYLINFTVKTNKNSSDLFKNVFHP